MLVNVSALDIVTTLTHSTANLPAALLDNVVSEAFHNSIVPVVVAHVIPHNEISSELIVVVPPFADHILIFVVEDAAPQVPRLTVFVVAAAVAFVE